MEQHNALIRHELKLARRANDDKRMVTLEKLLTKRTAVAWHAIRNPKRWRVSPVSDKAWTYADKYRCYRFMLRDDKLFEQHLVFNDFIQREVWVDGSELAVGRVDIYGENTEGCVFRDLEQALTWAKSMVRGPLTADWSADDALLSMDEIPRPDDPRLMDFPEGHKAAEELCLINEQWSASRKIRHPSDEQDNLDHELYGRVCDKLMELRQATAIGYAVLAYDYGASEIVPISPFTDSNDAVFHVAEHFGASLGFMVNHYGNLVIAEPTGVMSSKYSMGGFDREIELKVWSNVKVRIFRTLDQARAWHAANQVAALYAALVPRGKYYGFITSFENMGRPLALLGP